MSSESDLETWKKLTYIDELPQDIGLFRKLLEQYSRVPPNEIDELLFNTVGIAHVAYSPA
jgi:hypothetical protein